MTEDTLNYATRAAINAGHDLTTAVLDSLPPADREKMSLFAAAGAEIALTIRWTGGRLELRLGLVMSDEAPQTVYAVDFERRPGAGPGAVVLQ